MCTPTAACDFAGTATDTLFGWTGGGGVEVAITEHVSFKAEALYYDVGDLTVTATDPQFPAEAYDATVDFNGIVARGGLNFNF